LKLNLYGWHSIARFGLERLKKRAAGIYSDQDVFKIIVVTKLMVSRPVAESVCRDIVKQYFPMCDLAASAALEDELAEMLRGKLGLNSADPPFLKIYADAMTFLKLKPLPKSVCHNEDDYELLAITIRGDAEIISGNQNFFPSLIFGSNGHTEMIHRDIFSAEMHTVYMDFHHFPARFWQWQLYSKSEQPDRPTASM